LKKKNIKKREEEQEQLTQGKLFVVATCVWLFNLFRTSSAI